MKEVEIEPAEAVLDRFIEGLFRLMLDHHRTQAVEMDLTLPQAQALRLLRRAPVSTTKLAASLDISTPAMTQLTDRLARKRLIERQAAEGDRRSVMIALSPKGRRVVDTFRRRRNDIFAEALSRLSAEDRAEVTDSLSKVVAVLGDLEPEPEKPGREQVIFDQVEQGGTRTAVQPPAASKKIGQVPMGLPPKRMRIEWD